MNEIPLTNPDNVRSVYANSIGLSATKTDFRLFFTEVGQDPTDGGKPSNELQAIVVLPLGMAEGLAASLQQMTATLRAQADAEAEAQTIVRQ